MTAPASLREQRFRYRAATATGALTDGVVLAESREAAVRELRRQSLWPMQLDVDSTRAPASTRWTLGGGRSESVAAWTRTMATLVGAGASMDRALTVSAAQVSHPAVRASVERVTTAVRGGEPLAAAMRGEGATFSALHAGLVEAGEQGGQLPDALATLADALDEDDARRAQVRAALLYPALMGIVTAIGVLVLLLFVVPRFAGLLSEVGGTLPWATRLLVATGQLLARTWWLWLALIALGTVAAQQWVRTSAGAAAWGRLRLQLPIVGPLERTIATARFTRALGLMLRGGASLLPAVQMARNAVTNPVLRAELASAATRVARGEPLAQSVRHVVTPLAVQLLAVGEEGAQLDALATRAADAHDEAARRQLRTLAALLEPALVLTFGGIVGFVALAMLQAIYAVNTGLQ
jgi:general secretion pathway protein F